MWAYDGVISNVPIRFCLVQHLSDVVIEDSDFIRVKEMQDCSGNGWSDAVKAMARWMIWWAFCRTSHVIFHVCSSRFILHR